MSFCALSNGRQKENILPVNLFFTRAAGSLSEKLELDGGE
jgi:hypothetical protein